MAVATRHRNATRNVGHAVSKAWTMDGASWLIARPSYPRCMHPIQTRHRYKISITCASMLILSLGPSAGAGDVVAQWPSGTTEMFPPSSVAADVFAKSTSTSGVYPLVLIDTTPDIASVSTLVAPGNGNAGFGGALGTGNIALDSNTSGDVRITFTRGSGNVNDTVVVYLDSVGGGEPGTSNYTDSADNARTAISGLSGTQRAALMFPSPMQADYAIVHDPFFGALLFRLVTNGSHQFISQVAAAGSSTATSVDFNFNLSSLALPPGASFDFIATYLSDTAFRSDEYVGPSVGAGNTGYTVVNLPSAQYVRFFSANSCTPSPCLFNDGFEETAVK